MKTVIEMAREAGFEARRGWWVRDQVPEDIFAASVKITREIERFAALVRANEREACALICDEIRGTDMKPAWDTAASHCSDAIRARGQQ